MSKDSKKARNMKKLICRYVDTHYPDEANQLVEKTEIYYQKFKSEVPDIGGDANMLAGNLDMGLLCFAAYEASDHALAEMMHAKLIRTHTVALVSDPCDYWYVGDSIEAARNYDAYEIVKY